MEGRNRLSRWGGRGDWANAVSGGGNDTGLTDVDASGGDRVGSGEGYQTICREGRQSVRGEGYHRIGAEGYEDVGGKAQITAAKDRVTDNVPMEKGKSGRGRAKRKPRSVPPASPKP